MSEISELVDAWIEPMEGLSSGEDLEYDNDFLALTQAAEGKPETQFSEAEPPNWQEVSVLAQGLFERTRDLRIATYWARAQLHLQGLAALPEGLRLLHGLLAQQWDSVHPQLDPDDNDPYARLNVLAQWEDYAYALGDVRASKIFALRSVGQLFVRDVELARDRLGPREGETVLPVSSIEQMLSAAVEEDSSIAVYAEQAKQALATLMDVLQSHVGYAAPDFDELQAILSCVHSVMPSGEDGDESIDDFDFSDVLSEHSDEPVLAVPKKSRSSQGLGRIETRADAIKAIEMICEYLEAAEPTSPAQLLLRRAQKLIDKNFMDLMRELAPDSVHQLSKIFGVEVSSDDSDYDD